MHDDLHPKLTSVPGHANMVAPLLSEGFDRRHELDLHKP